MAVDASDAGSLYGARAAEVGQQPALEPLLAKAADGRSGEDHGLLLAGQLGILPDLVDLILGVPDRPHDGLHHRVVSACGCDEMLIASGAFEGRRGGHTVPHPVA